MTSRTPPFRVLTGVIGAFAAGLVWVPTPAQAATVTLTTSHTSAPPSVKVKFSGTAAGAATGAPVVLLRRLGSSGSWTTVKTGATVSASDTYAMYIYVAIGNYSYRTKVGSSSYSPARTVGGTHGRNVPVPAAGAPFTLSARLPSAWSRPVKAQVSTSGNSGTWTDRGTGSSNSGLAGVRTYLMTTGYVRVVAPATGSLPTWVGPKGKVTIGIDPVIQKILDDTNEHRDAHLSLPPLKLKASLNTVAGKWAYYMHQKCRMFHNTKSEGSPTNFWEQYPSGWKAAGENVAVGYSHTGVVARWIASTDGHHENIDGKKQPGASGADPNFTHIGIGYYFGTKCADDRYYVQNFATY